MLKKEKENPGSLALDAGAVGESRDCDPLSLRV